MPDRPNTDLPDRERPDRADPEELRDWDTVQRNETDETQRLAVVGGWVYRTMTAEGVAMCFVPAAHREG